MPLPLLVALVMGCADKDTDTSTPIDDTPPSDTAPGDTDEDTGGDTGEAAPDYDGDGSPDEEDCADTDPTIFPGAEEIPYDGIDQDCDGYDLTDWDADGFDAEEAGGEDCNDTDPAIHPDAKDITDNKIDDDCDGTIDEGADTIPEGWPLSFGGSGTASGGLIATDPSGDLFLAGNFTGEVDFDPFDSHFEESAVADGDVFLSQISAAGDYGWTWIGSSDERITVYSLTADADGNAIISGAFTGVADFDFGPGSYSLTSAGGSDAFIARISSSGSVLWAVAFGGEGEDAALSVVAGSSGRVYAAGYFEQSVTFDKDKTVAVGDRDAFVVQLDASGAATWVGTFGGEGGSAEGRAVGVNSEASAIVAGSFTQTLDADPGEETTTLTATSTDGFIVALDVAGDYQWSGALTGSGELEVHDLLVAMADDSVVLAGTLQGSTDLDPGEGESTLTASSADGFLCWLDSSGDATDATLIGGSGDDTADALAEDADGRLYLTGTFSSTMTLGGDSLAAVGSPDIYAARWDGDTLDWSVVLGNGSEDTPASIAADDAGQGWMAGSFTGEMDLDPGDETDFREPEGESGVWGLMIGADGPG